MACSGGSSNNGAAGSSGASVRGKRQELSFAERIQVILARQSGKSMRQLAAQFGCGKTQILNIISQKDAYLKEWEEKQAETNPYISGRKRRSRRTGNEEINTKVWEWYTAQKAAGIHVTGPMLQHEARSIARGLDIDNFAASNGWLDSFRRLHNLVGSQARNVTPEAPTSTSTASDLTDGHPTCSSSHQVPEEADSFDHCSDLSASSGEFDLSDIQPSMFSPPN